MTLKKKEREDQTPAPRMRDRISQTKTEATVEGRGHGADVLVAFGLASCVCGRFLQAVIGSR